MLNIGFYYSEYCKADRHLALHLPHAQKKSQTGF